MLCGQHAVLCNVNVTTSVGPQLVHTHVFLLPLFWPTGPFQPNLPSPFPVSRRLSDDVVVEL